MTLAVKTNGLEYKYTSLKSLKAVAEGPGGFEGYVSVFSLIDEGGDIILPGAYKNVIADFLNSGFTAQSHDWSITGVIGYPTEAREKDAYGLWVKTIFHGTPDAQAVRQKVQERLAAGKEVGQSIGYKAGTPIIIQPKDYDRLLPQYLSAEFLADGLEKAKLFSSIRVLPEIVALKENSIVTAPMNRRAGVASVKDYTDRTAVDAARLAAAKAEAQSNVDRMLPGLAKRRALEIERKRQARGKPDTDLGLAMKLQMQRFRHIFGKSSAEMTSEERGQELRRLRMKFEMARTRRLHA